MLRGGLLGAIRAVNCMILVAGLDDIEELSMEIVKGAPGCFDFWLASMVWIPLLFWRALISCRSSGVPLMRPYRGSNIPYAVGELM